MELQWLHADVDKTLLRILTKKYGEPQLRMSHKYFFWNVKTYIISLYNTTYTKLKYESLKHLVRSEQESEELEDIEGMKMF